MGKKNRRNEAENPPETASSVPKALYPTQANRTRTKLPTKRHKNREETTPQVPADPVPMPRQHRADTGGFRGRGRGGLGHVSRGNGGRGGDRFDAMG
jgi:hypothetical protein